MNIIDRKIEVKLTNTNNANRAERQRIVIIEDESVVALCLELQLASHFKLAFFKQAEEAFNYILENVVAVDLIITDHMLPGMSGMQLTSIIKRDPTLRHLPVILQSAENESCLAAYNIKPDFYLQKPCLKEQMEDAIRKALGLRNKV